MSDAKIRCYSCGATNEHPMFSVVSHANKVQAEEIKELRERLAAAESKEVCTKPHSDEVLEFCQACKIERLRSIALEGAGWAALIKPYPPLAFIAEAEHACGITAGEAAGGL